MRLRDLSARATLATVALSVLVIAWVDYATGVELGVFPLYFLPVLVVSLQFGRGSGLVTSAVCVIAWAVSNHFATRAGGPPIPALGDLPAMAIAFAAIALLGAQQRRLLDRERALSRTDGLTGLLNSRGFYEAAAIETTRSLRYRRSLAVAYLDLDDFKRVNDRFGHAHGDALLLAVGRALRGACRATDLVARLGGDEFVVLFPETDRAAAEVVLQKLVARVHEATTREGERVTVSVGCVAFTQPPPEVETLVREADAVMYSVKASGKDAVRSTSYGENQ